MNTCKNLFVIILLACSGITAYAEEDTLSPYLKFKQETPWFFERFNASTEYYYQTHDINSLNEDEYELLINHYFENNDYSTTQVFPALDATLFRHLQEHPDDPKYRILKQRILSEDFINTFSIRRHNPGYFPPIADRELVLRIIQEQKFIQIFRLAAPVLREDMEIVEAGMKINAPYVFRNLSNRLKADKKLQLIVIENNPNMIKYAIDPDREVVLKAATKSTSALRYVPYRYISDPEIQRIISEIPKDNSYGGKFSLFGEIALINDDEVRVRDTPSLNGRYTGVLYKNQVVELLKESESRTDINNESYYWYQIKDESVLGWVYGKYITLYVPNKDVDPYLDSRFNDEDNDWYYDRFGSSTDFSKSEVVTINNLTTQDYRSLITAAEQGRKHGFYALYATIYKHLKSQPDDPKLAFVKKKLYSPDFIGKVGADIDLDFLHESFFTDKPRVLSLCKYNHKAFLYASETLRNDRDFVIACIKQNGHVLRHLSKEIQDDQEIVLVAVSQDGAAIKYASKRLRDNEDVVTHATQTNGDALEFASARYKSDRAMVKLSLATSNRTLYFSDTAFHNDKELVALMVERNAHFYNTLPEEMKNDREIILALSRNGMATLEQFSDASLQDMEILDSLVIHIYSRSLRALFNKIADSQGGDGLVRALELRNNKSGGDKNDMWLWLPNEVWKSEYFVETLSKRWAKYNNCPYRHILPYPLSAPFMYDKYIAVNPACKRR